MVDDMAYSDIGSCGGEIHTPHPDRLAENGLRFTQFYNAARCCYTRAVRRLPDLHVRQMACRRKAGALTASTYPDSKDGRPIIPLEGRSFAPVFEGGKPEDHEALYWEHIGKRAIREGKWKLAWDRRTAVWELYDPDTDPTELNNMADKFPERVRAMQTSWEKWAERVGVRELP